MAPAVRRRPRRGAERAASATSVVFPCPGSTRDEQPPRVRRRRQRALAVAGDSPPTRTLADKRPTGGRAARRLGRGADAAWVSLTGSHSNLDGLHRIGETLQLELADGPRLVAAAADRPWPGRRRRPGPGHPGRSRTAGPPPPPDLRSSRPPSLVTSPPSARHAGPRRTRGPDCPVRRPVAWSRHRSERRRRTEHHHQPVTQILDLGTAGLGDGLPQDWRKWARRTSSGDIGPTDAGRARRVHDVREQDGHVLRGQPELPFAPHAPRLGHGWLHLLLSTVAGATIGLSGRRP